MTRSRTTLTTKTLTSAAAAAMLGTVLLGTGPAFADDVPVNGSGSVPLTLEIEQAGELFMSVQPGGVALVEGAAAGDSRTFTGTLPAVTVTDTRTDVPEDVAWSVVGQASDFQNTADPTLTISNEYLGWAPALVNEPAGNEGWVGAGEPVDSAAENGTGLTSGVDLLIGSFTSEEAQQVSDQWQATADLKLVAPADQLQSGTYTATLTLSLCSEGCTYPSLPTLPRDTPLARENALIILRGLLVNPAMARYEGHDETET